MAKGKRTGKGHDGRYAAYKTQGREAANRKRNLERALKEQPNNEQIAIALKSICHRRKTPVTPFWSATRIKVASLMKTFGGKVNQDIFSKNEKTAAASLMLQSPVAALAMADKAVKAKRAFARFNEQTMFSIGTRTGFSL